VGAYYYLVAQLPSLAYGQEPPMSSVHFLDLARAQLSGEDAGFLALLSLDPRSPDTGRPSYAEAQGPSGSGFVDRWRDWERALRLNLARLRAQRLKREALDPPVVPADTVGSAQQALMAENPLEAEMILDRARWNAIDQFQGIAAFSRNAVYAYFLKLLILERRASFKAEAGFAEYKSLYASILERAQPGAGEST
jgi:hypothetical protein